MTGYSCNPSLQAVRDMMSIGDKILLPVIIAALAATSFGCARQPAAVTVSPRIPATPFSVVATGDSNFDASQAATFAWSGDMQDVANVPHLRDVPLNNMLKASIANTMNSKGYRYTASPGTGDLVVGYSVSLDDAGVNSTAARDHGVQPGLNFSTPDPEKYEKGTIVIEVTEVATRRVAWRSALQGFSIIELDEVDRRKRLDGLVQRMLSGLPARLD